MKTTIASLTLFLTITGIACGPVCGVSKQQDLQTLAQQAVSEDSSQASSAIHTLRSIGPEGLNALLQAHGELLSKPADPALPRAPAKVDAGLTRLKAALDSVGQQKDCHASRLYWHTDFEQAKAAARASGKPILSLRLLGNLTDEYSCANSRFFRTALYANAGVSQYLRDHFVLHWKSVRPVPRITIDFGDGRKLERTITGNSIHYILAADGSPVDALPGLYGPKAFLKGLGQAEVVAREYGQRSGVDGKKFLQAYHQDRLREIAASWESDLTRLGIGASGVIPVSTAAVLQKGTTPPTAAEAGRVAVGKSMIEMPMVRSLAPTSKPEQAFIPALGVIEDVTWVRVAQLHAEDARLDEGSKSLMRAKNPTAFDASRLARAKVDVEDPLLRAVRSFERSIAEDTVRNEYLLHSRIHEWFAQDAMTTDVDWLNERVYTELFLAPSSDPWLGLAPKDVYTALPEDGLVLRQD